MVQYFDGLQVQQGQPVLEESDEVVVDANEILPETIVFTGVVEEKVGQLVSLADDDDEEVSSINEPKSSDNKTHSVDGTNTVTSSLEPLTTTTTTSTFPTLEDPTEISFTTAAVTTTTVTTAPFSSTTTTPAKGMPLASTLQDEGRLPPSTPLLSTPPPPGLSSPLVGQSPPTSSAASFNPHDGSPKFYDKFESISKQGFENVLYESEM